MPSNWAVEGFGVESELDAEHTTMCKIGGFPAGLIEDFIPAPNEEFLASIDGDKLPGTEFPIQFTLILVRRGDQLGYMATM